jgi:hypothetical protein
MLLQQAKKLIFGDIIGVEDDFGGNIKAIQPDPFRSIMITESMSRLDLCAIITVIIVWHVEGFMDFSKGGDSDRFW